jgi:hypothetical protein
MDKNKVYGDFYYEIELGGAGITRYIGNEAHVIIPLTLNSHDVARICHGSFTECDNLTTVTIPNGLAEIGMQAFEDCTSLTDVYFESVDVDIDRHAFNACSDFMVHCYENSTAHEFALVNILRFKLLDE